MSADYFKEAFLGTTGFKPMLWQERLYRDHFVGGDIPSVCDIPTGLGKTSVMAVWLIALAGQARAGKVTLPRRLVYVVNRRTVVDQATREAEGMRAALSSKPELREVAAALRSLGIESSAGPLAISTLRGQFADNAEWRNDPARPAVVVGTVDMIGSRLLFSGYGRGFKSRPLHAGFLGQDALLVHDEAHLEPAFQALVEAIESEQRRCRDARAQADSRPLRVMALTATSRTGGASFRLSDRDRAQPIVRQRVEARKGITVCPVDDERKIADQVAKAALQFKDSGEAILVFLRKLDDVEKVRERLWSTEVSVQVLTGTLRGLERDTLARADGVFARFMPKLNREAVPKQGTVYLVCTSAGEVGINISADHLVCDLTPFDSMAQRFGRVNRFGTGDAKVEVVHAASIGGADAETSAKPSSKFEQACARTLSLLHKLPARRDRRRDASPGALGDLPAAERQAAFTPAPEIPAVSEILFDAWALTSIRKRLPGRPPVADWLHGVAEWEPPETRVAWRDEVEYVKGEQLGTYNPEDLLEDYPLKPHELLRDRTDRVFKHLANLAEQHSAAPAWVLAEDDAVTVTTLGELAETGQEALGGRTVLLPPTAGGLKKGMLDGGSPFDEAQRASYDVADQWMDENNAPRRCRIWDGEELPEGMPMRLVGTIDTRPDSDDEADEDETRTQRRYWHWYVRPRSADDDGSRTARVKQDLEPHLQSAKDFASALVSNLGLVDPEASAVTLAARWHDLGKNRLVWQRSIGNRDYPHRVLAKSGGRMNAVELNAYRHEFGSVLDVTNDPEFRQLTAETQDLLLHLIAAHHGRARPHFPADEAFDPKQTEEAAFHVAQEVPRRFARLQRRYGRWGLAYLESLLRAADALASQPQEQSPSADAAKASPETRR